ncbi:MAG: thiamine pyrophosphate-dependent dehydrogenase E1 component subunit alpha [Deltaproteobacteria bacterium]|nr:thiamine pyrophosphate-dependent dehydrogenase E1 component subunit alpha [Deltaproteobacteria bacterium]
MREEFVLDEVVTVLREDGSADPATDPGLPEDTLVRLYKHLVLTRAVDERLVTLQRQGRIGFHIGSLGEEAAILGSAAALYDDDWLFPCYREFGALLLRGMPLQTYLDNMYGNGRDPVKGRQMPDHYTGRPYRFGSVSSPIGTQITQAVGFSWAAKLRGEKIAASVYFGDGATSSSEFHNGLNFAGVFKTPTVFLCRNNGWAISVPVAQQTASPTFAQKGFAYGVPGVRCDGNDLLAVYKVTRDAVDRARAGGGPTLIELLTHRLSGHSTSDDPKAYRAEAEMQAERARDPLPRLRRHLELRGLWSEAAQRAHTDALEAGLKAAVQSAEAAAAPSVETLFDDVFAARPWHLEEQRAACLAAPRARGHGAH